MIALSGVGWTTSTFFISKFSSVHWPSRVIWAYFSGLMVIVPIGPVTSPSFAISDLAVSTSLSFIDCQERVSRSMICCLLPVISFSFVVDHHKNEYDLR